MYNNKLNIGTNHSVYIIAEVGVNHNGDLDLAKRLVLKAVKAGVDAVKFQTFKTNKLVSKTTPKAKYQIKETKNNNSQFDMLKKFELSKKDHIKLIKFCNKNNIQFLSTPFDFNSVDLLEELNVPAFKIGSSDTNNLPLLEYIAKKSKPIILSTGMSKLNEVAEAVETIQKVIENKLILLHCVSNYPTKYNEVNLKAMDTLKKAFNIPVGFSDHTIGTEIPIAAVSRGADVIEKHFTLDKNMNGPDHSASLEPDELKEMVQKIRNVEKSLGDGIKKPVESEKENIKASRKSVVLTQDIKKGEKISEKHISIKRPGTGIPPKYYEIVNGFKVQKNISAGTTLKWNDLK